MALLHYLKPINIFPDPKGLLSLAALVIIHKYLLQQREGLNVSPVKVFFSDCLTILFVKQHYCNEHHMLSYNMSYMANTCSYHACTCTYMYTCMRYTPCTCMRCTHVYVYMYEMHPCTCTFKPINLAAAFPTSPQLLY